MIKVIGLHGLKGSGKSTSAYYLQEKYGFVELAFADRLKEFLEVMNPRVLGTSTNLWSLVHTDWENWDTVKRKYPEVRRLLQSTGEAARQVFGENFWIDQLFQRIEELEAESYLSMARFTVTDIRYPNELSRLKGNLGEELLTIKISRPGVESDGHISEAGLPDTAFNCVIRNDGSLSDLYANLDLVMAEEEIPRRVE